MSYGQSKTELSRDGLLVQYTPSSYIKATSESFEISVPLLNAGQINATGFSLTGDSYFFGDMVVSGSIDINDGDIYLDDLRRLYGTASWADYAITASYAYATFSGSTNISGTPYYISMFNSAGNNIENSIMSQSGINLFIPSLSTLYGTSS